MSILPVPNAPTFEHLRGPSSVVGIGNPRVSWVVETDGSDFIQSAYELEIARASRVDRFLVHSSEQILVPWPTEHLESREIATVRVRVASGQEFGDWSVPSIVEAGLLLAGDWKSVFISPVEIGGIGDPAPVLIGEFDIPARVECARLYATALGIYQASINDVLVDDSVLAPGWTSYEKRIRYNTYDVTKLLKQGRNSLSALLGNGWYRGFLGYMGERAVYGDRLAFLAQLEVRTVDGEILTFCTDDTWKAYEDVFTSDDLYNGQSVDLRRSGLSSKKTGVEEVPTDTSLFVAPNGPPIRPTGVIPATKIWKSPSGKTLVDFGQNIVGWVKLKVKGIAPGAVVVIRHAEVLENGELGTRPLRAARATDKWTIGSNSCEVLEPQLTIHGFRYAEVTGVPNLDLADIEAIVVGTDLKRTGWFSCSDERINRLHENVVWSTRGNFVDLPTDCPQRDERLGWTGDILAFAPTGLFLYDISGLLQSWLADLAVEQYPDGTVTHVVPNMNRTGSPDPAAAAWGDASTFVPWTIYERTGDIGILISQFASMRAWVDRVALLAGKSRLWSGGFQYGDWLDPTAPPDRPGDAKSDPDVIATAFFARSAWIVAQAAKILGFNDIAGHYSNLESEIRNSFAQAYVTPRGLVLSDTQTVYALALQWDLLPSETQRKFAGERLADLVRTSGFTIATGFVGTPIVCDALTRAGHVDLAYRMIMQTACPSWLFPVSMGATTVWERWDSMLPDGSINPGEMTSFNHYALGAIADWLHRVVAGIVPKAPGYRQVTIEPHIDGSLDYVTASHLSPYGRISVEWHRGDDNIAILVSIPVGVTADVMLPGSDKPITVTHGRYQWVVDDVVRRDDCESISTIRDLIDEKESWTRIVSAIEEENLVPGGEPAIARMLLRYLEWPVCEFLSALSNELHPQNRPGPTHPIRARVVQILG